MRSIQHCKFFVLWIWTFDLNQCFAALQIDVCDPSLSSAFLLSSLGCTGLSNVERWISIWFTGGMMIGFPWRTGWLLAHFYAESWKAAPSIVHGCPSAGPNPAMDESNEWATSIYFGGAMFLVEKVMFYPPKSQLERDFMGRGQIRIQHDQCFHVLQLQPFLEWDSWR